MTTSGQIQTTMTVEKVAEVEGKNGLQWECAIRFPWDKGQWPTTIWLDQDRFEKPTPGVHNVLIESKGVRYDKKKEQDFDGSQRWMHNWTVVQIGGDLPAPAPAQQQPQNKQEAGEQMPSAGVAMQQGTHVDNGSVQWGAALKSAVVIYSRMYAPEDLCGQTNEKIVEALRPLANALYPLQLEGPTQPVPDAPEAASSPVTEPEGTNAPDVAPTFNEDGTEIMSEVRVFANRGEFMAAAWAELKMNGGAVVKALDEAKDSEGNRMFSYYRDNDQPITGVTHIDHTDPEQWQWLVNVSIESGSV